MTIAAARHASFAAAIVALILAASPSPVQAQGPPLGPKDGHTLPATDLERVQAGVLAPDFTLERHGGGTVTLSEYRGKRAVILVSYRGHW